MPVITSLWASVQGDPVFMRRVNGWLTIFWVTMIPISYAMHWLDSVVYVSALSLWALVSGHWSAWQAARVEVKQEAEAKKREEEDIAGEVVQKIVAETNLQATEEMAASGRPGDSNGVTHNGQRVLNPRMQSNSEPG